MLHLDTQSPTYAGGQFAAVGIIISTLVHYLPTIALILPMLWYLVLFYDRFAASKSKSADVLAAEQVIDEAARKAKALLKAAKKDAL